MRRGRIRGEYPIFFAYGDSHDFLSAEEARNATADERIKSIWPLLVRRVLDFQGTLRSRERVNFDPEDTITELWVVLKSKDAEWSPDRGKYVTFAGVIVDREFCSIRDRSRTVQSPRNSSCRLKEYKGEANGEILTSRRSKTANDILRTSDGIQKIGSDNGREYDSCNEYAEDALDGMSRSEATSDKHHALWEAIQRLTTREATTLGKVWGLLGHDVESIFNIALWSGRFPADVRQESVRAMTKLRDFLLEIHPQPETE